MLPLLVSKTSTLAFFFKNTTSPLVSDLVSTIFSHSLTVSGLCAIFSGRLPCNRPYLLASSPRRHPPAKKFRQTPPTPGTIHQLFYFFPLLILFQFLPFILLASHPAQSASLCVACFSQLATVPRQQNLDSSPSCHRSFSADLPQSICPLRTSLRRRLLASASYRPPAEKKPHSSNSPRMFRRYALGFSSVGRQFSTMGSTTPMEDAIRAKVRSRPTMALFRRKLVADQCL